MGPEDYGTVPPQGDRPHPGDEYMPETSDQAAQPEAAVGSAPSEESASTFAPGGQPEEASTEGAGEGPHGPQIEIDLVEGDFHVLGGAPRVLLTADDEELEDDGAETREGVLRFSRLPDGSELRVPDGARVLVRQAYGDVVVEHFDGYFQMQRVGGDITLRQVAVAEIVQVGGDLEAEQGGALRVRSVGGDAEIEDYDEAPVIGHVGGELEARDLPRLELRDAVGGDVTLDRCGEATLIGTIGGDLNAERSLVTLRASAVGGDIHLAAVNAITVSAAGGDLTIASAQGAVEVHSVGGDAELRDTHGLLRLGTVGGDVSVENAFGGFHAGRVSGDVELDTPLAAGVEYSVHAAGDISLRARGEVNARFVAQTLGGEIRTRLPLTMERGRRRNLVGVIGHGDATVTLRSDGGDITITAADRFEEEHSSMSDDFVGQNPSDQGGDEDDTRTWEGGFGRHRFRVQVDRGPGRARFHFKGPYTGEGEEGGERDFHFEWEKGRGPRMYGEYEQRMNEFRERAEDTAKKAAEQASEYAERTAKRLRETDWEAVGREVKNAVERAVSDLEDAFGQVRREWETRRPSGQSGGSRPSGAQRVRIEYEDENPAEAGQSAASAGAPSSDEIEAQRRSILEQLRAGTISLDEAERRLNELR